MFLDPHEFENDGEYSIAVVIAKGQFGNHTGILTKIGNAIHFYHLAWHLLFIRDEWQTFISDDRNFIVKKWVKFKSLIDDPIVAFYRVPSIIKLLEKVYEKNNNKVPYALNFSDTKFSDDGDLVLGENEIGLTCATFVVSFFNSAAVELIDLSSWQIREEDNIWKTEVLNFMLKSHVPMNHIANVSKEELNYRIKPEEVAVATSRESEDLPTNFQFCSSEGAQFNLIASQ